MYKNIIGIDIGVGLIKVASFTRENNNLYLTAIKIIEIPEEKEKVQILKEIISDINIKNSELITSINSSSTMLKKIITPNIPENELEKAINLEAKNYFPFPTENSTIDFEIIGEIIEKGIKKLEVLISICPDDIIKEHLNLLNSARIKPACIIPASLALFNLLKFRSSNDNFNIAILDIGKSFSELVISRDKKLILNRKILVGGDEFTKAMTNTFFSDSGKVQLSYKEAEKVKTEKGISGISPQLFSLVRPILEKLSNEIERSFTFYREATHGEKINELILCGGSANLNGLSKFLSDELGVEVKIYTLEGINYKDEKVNKEVDINKIAVAIGTGITNVDGINFLPVEIKEKTKIFIKKITLKVSIAIIMTFLLFIIGWFNIRLSNLNKKIAGVRFELTSLKSQEESVKNLSLMSKILRDEPYFGDVLKEISNVCPNEIQFKEMNMQNKLLTIKGSVLTSKNPEGIISTFSNSLEKGIFKNVRIITIQDKEDKSEFELQSEME